MIANEASTMGDERFYYFPKESVYVLDLSRKDNLLRDNNSKRCAYCSNNEWR